VVSITTISTKVIRTPKAVIIVLAYGVVGGGGVVTSGGWGLKKAARVVTIDDIVP